MFPAEAAQRLFPFLDAALFPRVTQSLICRRPQSKRGIEQANPKRSITCVVRLQQRELDRLPQQMPP